MEDYSIHQIQCVFFILPYYCIHATAYCIHDITISHTHIQHPVSTIYTTITICTTTTHPHTYIHILHYILYCYRYYNTTPTYYTATIHFLTVLQVYTFTQYLHTQTHKSIYSDSVCISPATHSSRAAGLHGPTSIRSR